MVLLAGIITLQGLLTDASDGLLLSTARYSPVSYTHLDVYKRQEIRGVKYEQDQK